MNKPIRTMAVVCMLLFVALLLNATYLQYFEADDLNSRGDNKRVRDAEFSRERGAILVGGKPVARERAEPTTSTSTSASTPQPLQVRPRSPATTPTSTAAPPWSRARTTSSPAATRGCSSTGSSTCSATASPRAAASSLTIDPEAQTRGVRRAPGARQGRPGRGRRARPVDRQDPGDGHRTRPTTPTCWPRTTSARSQQAWERAERATEDQPLLNRGDPGDLPAGLDVQAGHRGGRAVERAVHPGHEVKGGATLDLPQTDDRPAQRERQRLRRRPDHADPGAGGLLQRLLRRHRPRARRRRAARAGREVRLRPDLPRRPRRPGRRAAFPGGPRRAADRAVGDRPVRRAPPPRCRWRWSPPASPTTAR